MFKVTLLISFMFIGTTILAARMSCDSCGSECAPACGTRRFRPCCFNYLRKKRDPEAVKFLTPNNWNAKLENSPKPVHPYFRAENIPEEMTPNEISDEYMHYFF